MVKHGDFCCSSNLFMQVYGHVLRCLSSYWDPLAENWNLKIHPKALNTLSNDDTLKSNQHLVQIDVLFCSFFKKNSGIFSLKTWWVFVEATAIRKVHLQRSKSPLDRPWGQWWRFWNPCLSWIRFTKRSKNIQRSEVVGRLGPLFLECFWWFLKSSKY